MARYVRRSSSGSLAMLTAMRRASSRVSGLAADRGSLKCTRFVAAVRRLDGDLYCLRWTWLGVNRSFVATCIHLLADRAPVPIANRVRLRKRDREKNSAQ
jgi:hypothetical protein